MVRAGRTSRTHAQNVVLRVHFQGGFGLRACAIHNERFLPRDLPVHLGARAGHGRQEVVQLEGGQVLWEAADLEDAVGIRADAMRPWSCARRPCYCCARLAVV